MRRQLHDRGDAARRAPYGPLMLFPFLTRGIPDVPAGVVGFFRPFFATFLFVALYRWRLPIDDSFIAGDDALRFDWIVWLINQPGLVSRLELALFALLVLFAIGLFTRIVYPLCALGFTLWILVLVQSGTNIHEWEVCVLTVLCLVPVRWGAALSLDALIRRRLPEAEAGSRELHGKQFGYAIWMPGFILGAVWLGAAVSKIQISGVEWILGGAVKYHWVIDSPQAAAPDLALWIASHHWASVLMSFMGVFLEATFITASFVRTTVARSLLGVGIGGALVAGFYMFHGVLWWTWALVLVSFVVPWAALYRLVTRKPLRPLPAPATPVIGPRRAQIAMMVVVCLLMVRQWPEGIGRFTSYSNTYQSIEDFEHRNPVKPTNRIFIGYGSLSSREVFQGSNQADLIVESITTLQRGLPLPASHAAEFPEMAQRLATSYGDDRGLVTWVEEKRAFDWDRGEFAVAYERPMATINLRTASLATTY